MNFKNSLKILKRLNLECLPGVTSKYFNNSVFGISKTQSLQKYYLKSYKYSILLLNEKRKLKAIYGLKTKNLKNFIKKLKPKTINRKFLYNKILNSNLDIYLVKLGVCITLKESRQFIKHGHVLINGYKTTSYNFKIKKNDNIYILKPFNYKLVSTYKIYNLNSSRIYFNTNNIVLLNKNIIYCLRDILNRELYTNINLKYIIG